MFGAPSCSGSRARVTALLSCRTSIYVLDRGEVNEALQSLELKLWLNGELRQSAQTNQLIYRPPETLSFISTFANVQAGTFFSQELRRGDRAATPKLVEILKTHLFATR